MDHEGFRSVANSIELLNPKKLFLNINEYIKVAAAIDNYLKERTPIPIHISNLYDRYYEKFLKESNQFLSMLTLSLRHLIDFRFSPNGQWKGIPEIDFKTYHYVQKLKLYHMTLLASISDNVEIISNNFKHSRMLRSAVLNSVETIQKATNLMGILHDRLVNRPTAYLKINHSSDKQIQELNNSFENMNSYENEHCSPFAFETRIQPVKDAYAGYFDLTLFTKQDISQRVQQIFSDVKELKTAWKIFKKLITKGYSYRMEGHLNSLVSDYHQRKQLFLSVVNHSRQQFIQ